MSKFQAFRNWHLPLASILHRSLFWPQIPSGVEFQKITTKYFPKYVWGYNVQISSFQELTFALGVDSPQIPFLAIDPSGVEFRKITATYFPKYIREYNVKISSFQELAFALGVDSPQIPFLAEDPFRCGISKNHYYIFS